MLNLSVFFLLGIMVAQSWTLFDLRHVVYALISLTVVRMIPVALALWGTGMSRATTVFMGWFGPRGLASIVLGLVYLEEATHVSRESTIPLCVMMTVLISIFAHGFSALPGTKLYERGIARLEATAPERTAIDLQTARAPSE